MPQAAPALITNPSRRRFLAAAPSAAAIAAISFGALGAAASPAAAPSGDAALLALGQQLLEASVVADGLSDAEFEAADAAGAAIAEQIAQTPATTLAGLRVKAFALRWCVDFEPIDLVEDLGDTTDIRVIASIVNDLLG